MKVMSVIVAFLVILTTDMSYGSEHQFKVIGSDEETETIFTILDQDNDFPMFNHCLGRGAGALEVIGEVPVNISLVDDTVARSIVERGLEAVRSACPEFSPADHLRLEVKLFKGKYMGRESTPVVIMVRESVVKDYNIHGWMHPSNRKIVESYHNLELQRENERVMSAPTRMQSLPNSQESTKGATLARVIKKDFVVIHWNKIGFTDHSVTLEEVKYPSGSKLEILRYATATSGEPAVVLRLVTGDGACPLRLFSGGYDSAARIVTVNWDTVGNRVTGEDAEDENFLKAYHGTLLILDSNRVLVYLVFSLLVFFLTIAKGSIFLRGSWAMIILGYAFIYLGSAQGGFYREYLQLYERFDWFSLDASASLPGHAGYYLLNFLFIPVALLFVLSLIVCLFSREAVEISTSSSGSYSYTGSSESETPSDKDSADWPFEKKVQIENDQVLEEKTFLDVPYGYRKAGTVERKVFSSDQNLYEEGFLSRTKVGEIKRSFTGKPKEIVDKEGRTVSGDIRYSPWRSKYIVYDEDGNEIAEIDEE